MTLPAILFTLDNMPSTQTSRQGEYARLLQKAKEEDTALLLELDAARQLARSALYPDHNRREVVQAADRALYAAVHQIHSKSPRTLTVPQMARLLNVTRARIYQMLQIAATDTTLPTDVQLPATDL